MKITTEAFIEKAKIFHGDSYKYSKTIYTARDKKVTVTCSIHGDFEQVAASHLRHGCSKCAKQNKKDTTESFIKKAKLVHKDFYDYSDVIYLHSLKPVNIICKMHGSFSLIANNHLNGQDCPSCTKTKEYKLIKRKRAYMYNYIVNLVDNIFKKEHIDQDLKWFPFLKELRDNLKHISWNVVRSTKTIIGIGSYRNIDSSNAYMVSMKKNKIELRILTQKGTENYNSHNLVKYENLNTESLIELIKKFEAGELEVKVEENLFLY